MIAAMAMQRTRGLAPLLVFALALSGCGESGTGTEASNTTIPADVDTQSSGEATQGTSPTGEGGTMASSSDATTSNAATSAADSSGTPTGTFGMPAEPMPCPADGEPSVLEIGHGSGQFTELASGPAPLVHGRQGGYHIVLGVRAPGLDTSGPGTAHLRGTVDGQVLADHPFVANLICEDESVGAQALWINLVLESTPAELNEKTVEIDVEVVDAQGVSASGSASVMIVDPDAAKP